MTTPEKRAVQDLRRWASEIQADWALALLHTNRQEDHLPPEVREARDEVTRRLDALMGAIDAAP